MTVALAANLSRPGPIDKARLASVAYPAAVVPPNQTADIFDNFGANLVDGKYISDIANLLTSEGYKVTEFLNPTEGSNGPGTATLPNFINMSRAGVVVFDTHALDVAKAKGMVTDILVEWDGSEAKTLSQYASYSSYYKCPLNKAKYVTLGTREIYLCPWFSVDHDNTSTPFVKQWGIGLTLSGIKRFFGGSHIALILGMACFSDILADSFHALSYFGYSEETISVAQLIDAWTLINRLGGQVGLQYRTTTGAASLGGFTPNFGLHSPAQPVVLSPAVQSVTPKNDTTVAAGSTVDGKVSFDAVMSAEEDDKLIKVVGCERDKVFDEQWSDEDTFTFKLSLPTACAPTLRVNHEIAVGGDPGWPNELDGNDNPARKNGVAPNGEDYVWNLVTPTTQLTKVTFGVSQASYSDSGDPDALAGEQWTATLGWNVTWDASSGQKSLVLPTSGTITPDCMTSGACPDWAAASSETSGSGTTNWIPAENGDEMTCSIGLLPGHAEVYLVSASGTGRSRTWELLIDADADFDGWYVTSGTCAVPQWVGDTNDECLGYGGIPGGHLYQALVKISLSGNTQVRTAPFPVTPDNSGTCGSTTESWMGTVELTGIW